ncbi:MAG TPA: NAD(P)H-dependent oxidoreductase [Casimicrobiaceae bacterium]
MPAYNVAVLVGSLRRDSLNRRMAHALARLAPERLALAEVPLGDLPLYNADLEVEPPPASWTAFRERIRAADAILFVTPEYNRSIPGVLKNAIDVGSRPGGKSVWARKPAAIVTVSPGALGGFGANHHLRQMMVPLDVQVLAQPEAYVGGAGKAFDDAGEFTSEALRELMTKFLGAFADWIDRLKR